MRHLSNYEKFNESNDSKSSKSDILDSMIKKLGGSLQKLIKLIIPYRETLAKKLSKYCKGGVIRADLIESDIKNLSFMRQSNEEFLDKESKIAKILSFIIGIPKKVVQLIAIIILSMVDDLRKGYGKAFVAKIMMLGLVAVLVIIAKILVVDNISHAIHGLDRGVITTSVEYTPSKIETRPVTFVVGDQQRTTWVREHVPERWTVNVRGIGSDSTKTETWTTFDKNTGEKASKGDTINLDQNWDYNLSSGNY